MFQDDALVAFHYIPVPFTLTVLLPTLVVMVTTSVFFPVDFGWNLMFISPDSPGASVLSRQVPAPTRKSVRDSMTALLTTKSAVPVFFKVIFMTEFDPTLTCPKLTDVGDTERTPEARPVPVSMISLLPALETMVRTSFV